MPRRRPLLALLGMVVLELSCQRTQPSNPSAIRLVDLHRPPAAQTDAQAVPQPARTEWRFDGTPPTLEKDAATWGWTAFNGVAGLAVRNGRLVGRTTGTLPVLHLQRSPAFEEREAVHGIEVRMRVSAGTSRPTSASRRCRKAASTSGWSGEWWPWAPRSCSLASTNRSCCCSSPRVPAARPCSCIRSC